MRYLILYFLLIATLSYTTIIAPAIAKDRVAQHADGHVRGGL